MKKYIGITLYLIGLICLSYLFFINSKKNEENINNDKNKIQKDNIIIKNNNFIKENQKKEILDSGNNIDKELENKIIQVKAIETNINTGNNLRQIEKDNNNNNNISEEIELPEFLFIGFSQLNLQKDTKYEEIYTVINLKGKGIYKIENKEIYIKPLDNNDYSLLKEKINDILKKIGGNIIETNLFGNKQAFINPDIYYKKQVIMLINFENKNYLVILPYKKYQGYKKFIKNKIFSK